MARLRPYLLRATYQWILDHHFTPYFLVNAEHPEAVVPKQYAKNGEILLNVTPIAVQHFSIDDALIHFEASFSGVLWQISFPMDAVLGLYARETGQGIYAREDALGMLVNEGESEADLDPTPPAESAIQKANRAGLRVVK